VTCTGNIKRESEGGRERTRQQRTRRRNESKKENANVVPRRVDGARTRAGSCGHTDAMAGARRTTAVGIVVIIITHVISVIDSIVWRQSQPLSCRCCEPCPLPGETQL
jgi:hypothetical protein